MAMELCWLQALAAFLFHWAFNYRTPLGFVLLIYVCGVLSYRYSSLRPRLRIQRFLIHAIGFGAGIYVSTWFFLLRINVGHLPVSLSHLLDLKHSLPSWGFLVILLGVSITVWRRSKAYVKDPISPENMYQRFDLGLAAFFSLLVLKLFCSARFNIDLTTPDLRTLFLPFIIFGLLNIGWVLNHQNRHRHYAGGFQKIGVALSFIMVMLCVSLGVVLLFHGQLTSVAENLSGVLKKVGPPLGSAVVWVIRLLWAPGGNRRKVQIDASDDLDRHNLTFEAASKGSWMSETFMWAMTVFGIVVFSVLIFLGIRWLMRFLLTKTGTAPAETSLSFDFRAWFKSLLEILGKFLHRVNRLFRQRTSALEFWAPLLSWGKRSGIPHRPSNTLMEYRNRLIQAFPELKHEIRLIVDLISKEVYGEMSIQSEALISARTAQKRMAHPRFWKIRLKTLLFPKWKNQSQNAD